MHLELSMHIELEVNLDKIFEPGQGLETTKLSLLLVASLAEANHTLLPAHPAR